MNIINTSLPPPYVAGASPSGEAAVAAITISAVVLAIDVIIEKVRSVANGIFDRIAALHLEQYLSTIIPGIMTILSTVSLIRSIIALHKAAHMGLGRDIVRHILDILRDLFNLISYVTSALQSLAILLKILGTGAIRVVAVISGVFGIIVDLIHLIRQAIHLYRTYSISNEMDAILNRSDLNAEEKVFQIIISLENRVKEREDLNKKLLEETHEDKKNIVEHFLEEQTKIEMEALLGEQGYARIEQAIKDLRGGLDKKDLFVEAVDAIRETKQILAAKIRQHWIEIAMDIISIAAQALCIAFPVLIIPMIAVYVLWTAYGALYIANRSISYIKTKEARSEIAFSKRENVEKYSVRVIEKTLKTLRGRVLPLLNLKAQDNERVDRIARVLLNSATFNVFVESAKKELITSTFLKMKRWLHLTPIQNEQIERIKRSRSIEDLRELWKNFKEEFNGDKTLRAKWLQFSERINLIEEGPSRLFSEALKQEWKSAI